MPIQFDIYRLLIRVPPLLFALTVHEYAHAYAAYRCGDPTAKLNGRLTLHPLSTPSAPCASCSAGSAGRSPCR